jgi:hypothetical protein
LLHDPPPQRVVRVKALADPAFRTRNPDWREELRGLIEATSDYFEREFDIRLIAQSTLAWPAEERIPSTTTLLLRLQRDFPPSTNDGTFDLIIGFTAEPISRYFASGRPRVDRIGDCKQGLGTYVVMTSSQVFRYLGAQHDPDPDIIALIHELGHIFGAEHVNDQSSIMHEDRGYRTEFDAKNRAVVLKNRACPFAK